MNIDLVDQILQLEARRGINPYLLRCFFVSLYKGQINSSLSDEMESGIDPVTVDPSEVEGPATSPVPADMPAANGSGERSEGVSV